MFWIHRILQALNTLAEPLVIGPENKFRKVQRNFAINLQVVQPQTFTGLGFSGIADELEDSELKNDSISTSFSDKIPVTSSASIILPQTIFNELVIKNSFHKFNFFVFKSHAPFKN